MRTLPAILLAALLILPAAPALAAGTHHRPGRHCVVVRHRHRHRRHVRCQHRLAQHPPAAPAVALPAPSGLTAPIPGWTPPALPTSGAPPSILGVGDVPGCLYGADPVPTLEQHVGASVMRVIVSPMGGGAGMSGEAVPCLTDAVAAGYRIELVIQWPSNWSDAQIADLFATEIGYYDRFAWAVALGNEQELVGDTAASYAEHWRVAAPIVRQAAPAALLVAGEVSPWGMAFLQQAWVDGLPGAQVIAAHTYQVQDVFSIPALEAWCARIGLPLWVTEGMAGPGEWSPGYELTAGQLLGVQAGFVWLG